MKLTNKILLVVSLFLLALTTNAQKAPIKFGKIDVANLKKEKFEIDPEAEAIILADYGRSWFDWSPTNEQFEYKFTRHVRIKILKKEGYKWANDEVEYYIGSGGSSEDVTGIKGFTYNLENGKVVKSKIDKKSIFDEKLSENWGRVKFTLPDVREGSIIEYSYTIISEFIAEFRSWNFQNTIPVLHTEYRAKIPEYYNYQQIQQGFFQFQTEYERYPEKFTISYRDAPGEGGRSESGSYTIDSNSHNYRWWADDVPALKKEPYITSLQNYFSRIEFMLSYTRFPNGAVHNYMGDYNSFNKTLLEGSSYGRQLDGGGYLKDAIEGIQSKYPDEKEQVVAIYNHIRDHMTWNGRYGKYPTDNLRSSYKDNKGNVGAINLLLVLMLKEAGIMADPVVLASRDGYKAHPVYPISSKLNYVVAMVTIDNTTLMMDATDKDRPFYILPERALSGQGWVVRETNPGWVKLKNDETMESTTVVNLRIEDDILMGDVEQKEESLLAFQSLGSYKESKEDYEEYYTGNADWMINGLEITQEEAKPLNLVHKFEIEHSEDLAGSNIIYVNPVLFSELTDNKFKLESRLFPVEYPCPEKEVYMMTLEIPEGFVIDELPEPQAYGLPDNGGTFRYNANPIGNTVVVTFQFMINKQVFGQNEYPNLREFYNLVAAKCSEQIVLKRKS